MFQVLSVFKRTHGHCDVPPNPAPGSLRSWLSRQEAAAFNGELSPARCRRLEGLGVDMKQCLSRDERWALQLAALRKFKRKHGHSNVSRRVPEDHSLAVWLSNQRIEFKKGRLSEERCEEFQKLGVALDPCVEKWELFFAGLLRFRKRFGHLEVTRHFNQPHGLGSWVSRQRLLFRQNRLEEERIERLNGLGFHWNPLDPRWDKYFLLLQKFKARHGHCNVPGDGTTLSAWVRKQRIHFQQARLNREQLARMAAIGFDWVRTWRGNDRVEGTWRRHMEELAAFKKRHGHCRVPQAGACHKSLGGWVSTVRKEHRKGRLWPERVRELDALGFSWDYEEGLWNERFAELVAYKEANGHCEVPGDDPNQRLARFVKILRRCRHKQSLSVERIQRLEALGFVWNANELRGEVRMAELRAFRRKHGHCRVPQTHANTGLAAFVSQMRILKRKGQIDVAREAELEELGFEWEPYSADLEQFFSELAAFRQEHGHCNLASGGRGGSRLYAWVERQRRCHRNGTLDGERAARLEELGLSWVSERRTLEADSWDRRLAAFIDYHRLHGDFDVPAGWQPDPLLRRWVQEQCALRVSGRIKPDRARRLEEIGFDWELPDQRDLWEVRHAELVEFHRLHGHCRVPSSCPNKALFSWVRRQQSRRNSLAEERRMRLEALEFCWREEMAGVAEAA